MKLRHKKMARCARRNSRLDFTGLDEVASDGNDRFDFIYSRTGILRWHLKFRSRR